MRDNLIEEFMETVVDVLRGDRLSQPLRSGEQELRQLSAWSHSGVGHSLTVTQRFPSS